MVLLLCGLLLGVLQRGSMRSVNESCTQNDHFLLLELREAAPVGTTERSDAGC